jgi:hypothetical protein
MEKQFNNLISRLTGSSNRLHIIAEVTGSSLVPPTSVCKSLTKVC